MTPEELKKFRTDRGWSTTQAAAVCGVSANYWSMMERGTKTPGTVLVKLIETRQAVDRAEVFRIPPELTDHIEPEVLEPLLLAIAGHFGMNLRIDGDGDAWSFVTED